MKAKHCVIMLLIGATAAGGCNGEGPIAPRALYLMPDCSTGCIWGWGGYLGATSSWLRHLNGAAGATLTVDAQVTDSALHTIPGVRMRWAVVNGGGSIDSATVRSDSAGVLRVRWTLDTLAGVDSLRGWFPSGDSVLAIAAVQHAVTATATKASGDSQVVAVGGTPRPLVVRVTDKFGNPVPGTHVAWTLGGLGSVTALTTTTGADGTTSNTLDPPPTAGVYAVIATFGVLRAVVFSVTAR